MNTICLSKGFCRTRAPALHTLAVILLLGFALRTVNLTVDRFHADEALYAGWALGILDGDPLLHGVSVDKPPLYLYTLAGSFAILGHSELAARLPSLFASMIGIVLVHYLGRKLYGPTVGVWAALMLALSPFDILFARTAFTDSVLVAWILAALCTVIDAHWYMTGFLLGLAFATKQHAVLLIPLVLVVGVIQTIRTSETSRLPRKDVGSAMLKVTLGFLLPFLGVLAWDATRWTSRPSYWQQSAMSYGGLAWVPVAKWGERLLEWASWGRYLAGSWLLASLMLLACGSLLVFGWLRHPKSRETWLDTCWMAYLAVYVGVHTVLQFSIWDRYLLPLAPLSALLLARTVDRLESMIESLAPRGFSRSSPRRNRWHRWLSVFAVCLLVFLALFSGYRAARNGYPIGGDHWAYQGIDEIVAYLGNHAPPDAVIYHHWLRWHYSYYLYGTTFELRWWESGAHMQREVLRTPERVQYVVLPDWRTLDPDAPGLDFELLYQARRRDQSVSLSLYRVTPRLSGCLPEETL